MGNFDEKYRRKSDLLEALPAQPAARPSSAMEVLNEAAEAGSGYTAFNAVDQPELELWIRPNSANAWTDVYLPYGYRNHMISDGGGFVISMHYSADYPGDTARPQPSRACAAALQAACRVGHGI